MESPLVNQLDDLVVNRHSSGLLFYFAFWQFRRLYVLAPLQLKKYSSVDGRGTPSHLIRPFLTTNFSGTAAVANIIR